MSEYIIFFLLYHSHINIEKNASNKLLHISLGDNFFLFNTKNVDNKSKNTQVGLYQTPSFCTDKETIHEIERQPNGRKYFQILYLLTVNSLIMKSDT